MINLSSWLVFGMWLWSETKTGYDCFLMAYCCPLSNSDGNCSQTLKTDTVAQLPNYSKRNKTITIRRPSNNSQNTISAVTVIPSLSARESASRNPTADAALLCPNVCFIWALCLKHTCGSNMWPSAPTETDCDPERFLMCTSLERATLTPN